MMTKSIATLAAALLLCGGTLFAQNGQELRLPTSQEKAAELPKTTAKFTETEYDFGTIPDGTKVKHTFEVINTGNQPLHLIEVKPTCGCTAADYTKDPIPPGGKGTITAEFNSAGRPGMANKTISVTGNFDNGLVTVLRIKGEVK